MINRRWWTLVWVLPTMVLAKTWTVDDDHRQCRHADFARIQDAVDAARPGDRIHVCPGLYAESVTVDKSLTLEGSGPDWAIKRTGDPSCESVVRPPTFDGITLAADRVKVSGFTVWARTTGIRTSGLYSGYTVDSNAVWDFDSGMRILSNNQRGNEITWNAVKGPGTGIADGIALLFLRKDTKVLGNRVRGFRICVSIVGEDVTPTGQTIHLKIKDNEVSRCQTGIELTDGRDVVIRGNEVSQIRDFGILIGQSEQVSIVENEIRRVTAGSGIAVVQTNDYTLRENQLAEINALSGQNASAIGLFLAWNGKIEDNLVHDVQGNGIGLAGVSFGNRFEDNKSHHNTLDGLFVGTEPYDNKFVENTAFRNGEFDARDDHRTANKWCETWCRTDSPPGTICLKSDPGCSH